MNSIFHKSHKLAHVSYDIRGPVLEHAKRLEQQGQQILKLNIGNPAAFGFTAPDEMVQDITRNLANAHGYCDSKGLLDARVAIVQESQRKNIKNVTVEQVYIGNGVSELIQLVLQALLNEGDEILIPAPDYPLWTAASYLAGGQAVHYLCDENNAWQPDLEDLQRKITPRSKALLIINPNNPTGAVYSRATLEALLEIARQNQLIVFADEIYDKILYEDAEHISVASLADDLVIGTFNGLSKNYRCAGYRVGWLILSGALDQAKDYIEGLNILSSMRLCANVPSQYAIQTALGGYQSIADLVSREGRLRKQRDIAWQKLNAIPGVSCVKPMGALYQFLRLDHEIYPIKDDQQLVLDLLLEEQILLVQGTAFNWPTPDHLRIVTLPDVEQLSEALDRFAHFLARRQQKSH